MWPHVLEMFCFSEIPRRCKRCKKGIEWHRARVWPTEEEMCRTSPKPFRNMNPFRELSFFSSETSEWTFRWLSDMLPPSRQQEQIVSISYNLVPNSSARPSRSYLLFRGTESHSDLDMAAVTLAVYTFSVPILCMMFWSIRAEEEIFANQVANPFPNRT